MPIEHLHLPVRQYNNLLLNGIDTIEALQDLSENQLLELPGLGPTGVDFIKKELKKKKLSLKA